MASMEPESAKGAFHRFPLYSRERRELAVAVSMRPVFLLASDAALRTQGDAPLAKKTARSAKGRREAQSRRVEAKVQETVRYHFGGMPLACHRGDLDR